MAELRRGGAQAHRSRCRDVGDLTQRKDDLHIGQRTQRDLEIAAAGCDLARFGLVRGRQAFDGVEDDRTGQPETVRRIGTEFPFGETKLEQGRVKQLARIIAGEWPPGPVGAMLAGREAHDRQPRIPVAERRHRSVPPMRELDPALLAKRDQPRTQWTVARGFGLGDW
jgi:hypothetical protein